MPSRTIAEIELDGVSCPNCGAETLWPLTGDRVQCRTCLKVTTVTIKDGRRYHRGEGSPA